MSDHVVKHKKLVHAVMAHRASLLQLALTLRSGVTY